VGVELPDAAAQQLDWEGVEQPDANMTATERGMRITFFMG
jgi:hypothetical protein